MNTSIFIAKILGLVYIAAGLGLIFNPNHYHKVYKSFVKDPALTYLGGAMALVAGFLIVYFHNVWIKDWIVLVTILGWAALVKGVMLLVFPDTIRSFSKTMFKKHTSFVSYGFFALILGVILSYFGYLA